MELTLPIPAPSIATMKIDNCRSINRTCAKKLYTQMQAGAIFIGCNYIEYRIRYTGGGKKGGEEAYILGWFWVVFFFSVNSVLQVISGRERERERERGRDREGETETDRQTDRETGRDRKKQREKRRDRKKGRDKRK